MSKTANDIVPNHLTHPGEILKDEIEARELSQAQLAKATGIAKSQVSHLLAGERNITPQLALKLESVLDIKAENWLNLQNRYDYLLSIGKLKQLRNQQLLAA